MYRLTEKKQFVGNSTFCFGYAFWVTIPQASSSVWSCLVRIHLECH